MPQFQDYGLSGNEHQHAPAQFVHSNPNEPHTAYPSRHRRSRTDVPRRGINPSRPTYTQGTTNQSSLISESHLEDVSLDSSEVNIDECKPNRASQLFSGIFQGESAPIRLGVIPSPRSEGDINNSPTNTSSGIDRPIKSFSRSPSPSPLPLPSPTKSYKRMSVPSPLKQVASTNPFSFFTSKMQPEQKSQRLPEPADDQLLNLDIQSALLPPSASNLPPHEAFAHLQHHAEALVHEFQAAYKLRTFALHEALAEKTTQQDELEETHSRVQNIKSQLNGMAEKVLEQDKALKVLTGELNAERQKNQEEKDTQERNDATPIKVTDSYSRRTKFTAMSPTSQKRHSKQFSGATLHSDSGFESENESVADSVFSREADDNSSLTSRLSTTSLSTPSTPMQSPSIPNNKHTTPKAHVQKPAPRQPSAYDRVIKGISSSGIGSSLNAFTSSISRCPNCRGGGPADAWTIVGILREENRSLKVRMVKLEAAVDECITLAGG